MLNKHSSTNPKFKPYGTHETRRRIAEHDTLKCIKNPDRVSPNLWLDVLIVRILVHLAFREIILSEEDTCSNHSSWLWIICLPVIRQSPLSVIRAEHFAGVLLSSCYGFWCPRVSTCRPSPPPRHHQSWWGLPQWEGFRSTVTASELCSHQTRSWKRKQTLCKSKPIMNLLIWSRQRKRT